MSEQLGGDRMFSFGYTQYGKLRTVNTQYIASLLTALSPDISYALRDVSRQTESWLPRLPDKEGRRTLVGQSGKHVIIGAPRPPCTVIHLYHRV
jgi:hypothetical protein